MSQPIAVYHTCAACGEQADVLVYIPEREISPESCPNCEAPYDPETLREAAKDIRESIQESGL